MGRCLAAAIPLLLVDSPASPAPSDLATALNDCAVLTDAEQRLGCYDALAGRAACGRTAQVDDAPVGAIAPVAPVAAVDETQASSDDADRDKQQPLPHWLGFRPYRRNYVLPISYNSRGNDEPVADTDDTLDLDDVEVKFQFSFEVPVWERIGASDVDLYFGYTQLSFFQAYNTDYSSPFRETSYEPELGLHWHPDLEFRDWKLKSVRLALNHQSNGRSEPFSRSWNRVVGQVLVENGPLHIGLRPWQRIAEDAEDDDNPDIVDFLGHGELYAGYDLGRHRLGLMVRNPVEHAGVQADWSYPLGERVRFYVQYFNGYGESLIDYDRKVNRIGAGFLLNDWP